MTEESEGIKKGTRSGEKKVLISIGQSIDEIATDLGKRISHIVEAAKTGTRDNVIMVRVNDETFKKLNSLVEAEIFQSRSESAAFLIEAGIRAERALFEKIAEKVSEIRRLKEELRRIVGQVGPPDKGNEPG